jgi:hypothetical protein
MRSAAAALPDSHAREIGMTAILTGRQVMNAIPVEDVVRRLNASAVRFVLVGAHGLAGWRHEARATEDIDVVVMAKHQKKATKVLSDAFPQLVVEEHEVVIRLRHADTQKVAIDLIKTVQPLFREAFKHVASTHIKGQVCNVPTLEMALAMKFAPMISLTREDYKKHMDASDFIRMVKMNPDIDLGKLAALGELVYPGGGTEIVEKVRQVRAGERLQL